MSPSRPFVSSCTRRELARRRGHRRLVGAVWAVPPPLAVLGLLVVCAGAFIAGRGGL